MPVTSNRMTVSTPPIRLGPTRRDVAERWLASDDPRKVMYALLRLSLNGPDFAFAERMALKHATHRMSGFGGTRRPRCLTSPVSMGASSSMR
jgi:hypothetical protein